MSSTAPNQKALGQIINQILNSRRIGRTDQQRLMGLLLSQENLSSDNQAQIDIIFDRLSRGLIHVVD